MCLPSKRTRTFFLSRDVPLFSLLLRAFFMSFCLSLCAYLSTPSFTSVTIFRLPYHLCSLWLFFILLLPTPRLITIDVRGKVNKKAGRSVLFVPTYLLNYFTLFIIYFFFSSLTPTCLPSHFFITFFPPLLRSSLLPSRLVVSFYLPTYLRAIFISFFLS